MLHFLRQTKTTARFSGTLVPTRHHILEDINLQEKERIQCISHGKQYKWIENFHGKPFWKTTLTIGYRIGG